MSDADDLDENTGEHLHLEQIMPFKKNKIDDDDDENTETFEETMKIDENDFDATLYGNYMWCFRMTRKGADELTKESFDVTRVYRNRRFITCLVKNFYLAARTIPYPLLVRGNGAGSLVGHVFLHSIKCMPLDFHDPHLQNCCIDLNELMNYGTKGTQFGSVSDDKVPVPFEFGKGGRIKKFSEDKTVDVLCCADDVDFWDIKNRLVLHYRGDYVSDLNEMTPTPVNPMTGDWYINHKADKSDNKSEMETSTSGVINDMERVLYEEERARVLAQVNLELARLQLENLRRRKRGLKTLYVLDNTTRLKLFFHLTQGEETNGLTPMTIRHFRTQDFTLTSAYGERRDLAEGGEDSEEDWNEMTLNETLEMTEMSSGYEFEYEGVDSVNVSDEDGADAANFVDGDCDENEGESEVYDEDDRAGKEGMPLNIEVRDEVLDKEDELLGDSLNDSMEITQETEEELLGPSDAGPVAASTPTETGY